MNDPKKIRELLNKKRDSKNRVTEGILTYVKEKTSIHLVKHFQILSGSFKNITEQKTEFKIRFDTVEGEKEITWIVDQRASSNFIVCKFAGVERDKFEVLDKLFSLSLFPVSEKEMNEYILKTSNSKSFFRFFILNFLPAIKKIKLEEIKKRKMFFKGKIIKYIQDNEKASFNIGWEIKKNGKIEKGKLLVAEAGFAVILSDTHPEINDVQYKKESFIAELLEGKADALHYFVPWDILCKETQVDFAEKLFILFILEKVRETKEFVFKSSFNEGMKEGLDAIIKKYTNEYIF